jgi:hypothetical protein
VDEAPVAATPVKLFSPSRLDIKLAQKARTNCLGRMIAARSRGSRIKRRPLAAAVPKSSAGNPSGQEPLMVGNCSKRRNIVGRPIVMGLGTLILIIIVVAILF